MDSVNSLTRPDSSNAAHSSNYEGFDNRTVSTNKLEEPPGKNKPKDSKLRQQKLVAWQPILTAGTVVPCFFLVGLVFLPIGVGLFVSTQALIENVLDYTHCKNVGGFEEGTDCSDLVNNLTTRQDVVCKCVSYFYWPKDTHEDVFFYYGLSNYYQNHRRYVKSRSDSQLLGDLDSGIDNCAPYETGTKLVDGSQKDLPYAPCGAIANSMFNDTFAVYYVGLEKNENIKVNVTSGNVAWPTDRGHKFKNPSGNLEEAFKDYAKPPNWRKAVYELDPEHPGNNGFENADFIVWMRTAALPTFRKLYRKLAGSAPKMAKGHYRVDIDYNYPVGSFDGSKRFIVSTTSWVGGKNSFLGVAYIVVGSLCILLGVVFLIIHLKFGKSLSEMSAMSTDPMMD